MGYEIDTSVFKAHDWSNVSNKRIIEDGDLS